MFIHGFEGRFSIPRQYNKDSKTEVFVLALACAAKCPDAPFFKTILQIIFLKKVIFLQIYLQFTYYEGIML